jgi:uncharacterized membrane protein
METVLFLMNVISFVLFVVIIVFFLTFAGITLVSWIQFAFSKKDDNTTE